MVGFRGTLSCLTFAALVAIANSGKTIKNDENYRLTHDHEPYYYSINLTITEATFYGKTFIEFTTHNSTITTIQLHVSPKTLFIENILYDFVYNLNDYYIDNETEIMTIQVGHKLGQSNHSLTIDYIGIYPKEQFLGLYKTVYDNGGVSDWYVSTQFEPTYARRVFPCFDEPGFKAPFDIVVTHPSNMFALANTPVEELTHTPQGNDITVFKQTPPMPTYTLALVVSNLAKSDLYPNTNGNFNYTVFSRPNMKKYTGIADRYGSILLDMLADWTGIRYEDMGNKEIAQVAVMNFDFGAMENWGLVVYRENYILDEGVNTTNFQKQKIIMTMSHELAHQWFGNLVTLDWWSDAWLNEGFATYCQYYVPGNSKFINMYLEEQYSTDIVHAALNLDAYPSTPPLSSEGVETPEEDLAKFDAISYKKGGSIIRMLRSIMGHDNFQKGVQNYLNINKWGNANPKKLLAVLNDVYNNSAHNLTDLMNNWIYKSGYPVLTVELSKDGKSVNISQQQFLYVSDNTSDTKWYVPIAYSMSDQPDISDTIKTWLTPTENLTMELDNSTWILLNMQATDYYRVNYVGELLNRFIDILKGKDKDNMLVFSRAKLVDDMLAFGRAGLVKYDKVFDLLDYLKNETEYQPWVSTFKGLSYLMEKFVDDDKISKLLKVVVLDWITAAFANHPDPNPTQLDVLRRVLITEWKCKTNDEHCISNAKEQYATYKTEHYFEDNNIRDTILCYGFRNSKTPMDDYNLLLKNYKTTESVSEASAILFAIGCTEDEKVLSQYLKELISKNTMIARQDSIDVFRYIVGNKKGIDLALEFVYSNIENILLRDDGAIDIDDIITGLADKITTEKQLDTLEFIINNSTIPDMEPFKYDTLDNVRVTLKWIATYKNDMTTVLKKYDSSNAMTFKATFSIVLSVLLVTFLQML